MLLAAIRELAPHVDIIGWHPFYQTDPDKPAVRGSHAGCAPVPGVVSFPGIPR